MKFKLFLFFTLIAFNAFLSQTDTLPDGFVYIDAEIPGVVYEIRYAGSNNFIGKPVKGYKREQAILSEPAAKALAKVQKELISKDYMLKIFDAYRPQTAVNHFIEWAREPGDTLNKQQFYPDVSKKNLFELGYIASRSGHSRGSTVDLTIIHAETCEEVDMGSTYDFFGEISHHNSIKITEEQKRNRELLKNIMSKYGFRAYPEEWWHYTYRMEPYPDTYFDFPVE
ncbi:M15 family metallopeptidase [Gramella jeungdoensis]|uniref:D-alanyl-D-alanine dipeptidase n=1 Tax=Gramella jeungdoensis TaxID=708091 RepID=A0ABT0Z5E4_9FLAO|nr:M15 family metallopeptidase [Gramella jeungdoensis]MCM8570655.1 M15 family metallopeptidase [Gramella jeungdoensis]